MKKWILMAAVLAALVIVAGISLFGPVILESAEPVLVGVRNQP